MLEEIIKSIRDFFYQKKFHEVIIPILNKSLPLEPNIYAFKVGNFYLPTSPEAALKEAIAKGIGDCFAIGHTFRDMEGISAIHKPEFLMLEWYREKAEYKDIMKETRDLILSIHKAICKSTSCKEPRDGKNFITNWKVLSMAGLFQKYANLNLEEIIDDAKLIKAAEKLRFNTQNSTWEQLFNQIFLNKIEPHLPKEPFFLIDYPARISPLCARRKDKPYLAERFELYMDGIEIANGNTENTDAEEVLKAMKDEEKYRKKKGLICPPVDLEFIEAIRKMHGKSYAGIGLGIERLAMIIAKSKDIKFIE